MEKMTRKELNGKKVADLRGMAIELGVKDTEVQTAKKDDVIKMILEKMETAEVNKTPMGDMELGEQLPPKEEKKEEDLEDIDDILARADNQEQKPEEKEIKPEEKQEPKQEEVKPEQPEVKTEKPEEVAKGNIELVATTVTKDDGKAPSDDIIDLTNVPTIVLPLNLLESSPMNFFKPLNPKKLNELKESIKASGVLTPIIVRPNGDKYEILAGHNRVNVCREIGRENIIARLVTVSDEKAKEIIIDTNVAQRQELSAMEIAKAYDEKAKILGNRQGKRSDLDEKALKGATQDIIGQEYGKSGMTVQRYLRLMNLIPEIQWMVDKEEIAVKTGMEIGLINEDIQKMMLKGAKTYENLTTAKASKVRKMLKEKEKNANGQPIAVSQEEIDAIMQEKPVDTKTLPSEVAYTLKLDFKNTIDKEYIDWVKQMAEDEPEWIVELIIGYKKGIVTFME